MLDGWIDKSEVLWVSRKAFQELTLSPGWGYTCLKKKTEPQFGNVIQYRVLLSSFGRYTIPGTVSQWLELPGPLFSTMGRIWGHSRRQLHTWVVCEADVRMTKTPSDLYTVRLPLQAGAISTVTGTQLADIGRRPKNQGKPHPYLGTDMTSLTVSHALATSRINDLQCVLLGGYPWRVLRDCS